MKPGYLSEFFAGVALKNMSAVEADPGVVPWAETKS
jgi:hypothetical protein